MRHQGLEPEELDAQGDPAPALPPARRGEASGSNITIPCQCPLACSNRLEVKPPERKGGQRTIHPICRRKMNSIQTAKRQRARRYGLPRGTYAPPYVPPSERPTDLAPDVIDAIAAAALVHIRYQRRRESEGTAA